MTQIALDIVEHLDSETGAAAIRVRGARDLPSDPQFRIEPLDEALLSGGGEVGWPAGPRRPIAVVSRGDDVVDLMLGADVLESPMLAPGTPVAVSLVDMPVRTELIWPAIAIRSQRAGRPVIVTDELREAERLSTEARRTAAAETLAAATARAASVQPLSGGRRARAAAGGSQRVPRLVASGGAELAQPADATAPSDEADATARQRVLSGLTLSHNPKPASLVLHDDKHFGLTTTPTGTAVVKVPSADPDKPSFARQAASFVAGMAAAVLLVFGLTQSRIVDLGSTGLFAKKPPDVAVAAAKSTSTLRAVLASGGVSPRGRASAGVSAEASLALADRHLHGSEDAPKDQGEASFWLRHALSQALGHEPMKWALTQLGTIYAAPDGFEPDYAKARLVWEIAGAMGDPVALCFNAQLYEFGLGVPKHFELARTLYERARNAGGCQGLDVALARLK